MPSNEISPPTFDVDRTDVKTEFSADESNRDGNTSLEAYDKRKQIREACLVTAAIVCFPSLFGCIVWSSAFLKGWFHDHPSIYVLSLFSSGGLTIASIFKPAIRRGTFIFQIIAVTLMAGYVVTSFS